MELLNKPHFKPAQQQKQPNKYELQLMQAIQNGEAMARVNKQITNSILNTMKG